MQRPSLASSGLWSELQLAPSQLGWWTRVCVWGVGGGRSLSAVVFLVAAQWYWGSKHFISSIHDSMAGGYLTVEIQTQTMLDNISLNETRTRAIFVY